MYVYVCVCMCMYVYVCMYVCMYVCIYIYTSYAIAIYIYMYIYICILIHTYIYIYRYVCMYVCIYVCLSLHGFSFFLWINLFINFGIFLDFKYFITELGTILKTLSAPKKPPFPPPPRKLGSWRHVWSTPKSEQNAEPAEPNKGE